MSGCVPEASAFCPCRSFPGEAISLRSTFSSCLPSPEQELQPHLQEVSKSEAGQDACRDQPPSASGSILLADALKEKAIAQQQICCCPLCSLWRGTPGQELAPTHPREAVGMYTPEMPAWIQSACEAETPHSHPTLQSCSTGSPPACRYRKSESFPPR